MTILAIVAAVYAVEAAHDGSRTCLPDRNREGSGIDLLHGALVHDGIRAIPWSARRIQLIQAVGFLVVQTEVFQCTEHGIRLDAANARRRHGPS